MRSKWIKYNKIIHFCDIYCALFCAQLSGIQGIACVSVPVGRINTATFICTAIIFQSGMVHKRVASDMPTYSGIILHSLGKSGVMLVN